MKQRGLAGLDGFQVVERESDQADHARQQKEQRHGAERGRSAADVAEPISGGAAKEVAENVGGDDSNQDSPRKPALYDVASHAILPVRPAGWSRTSLPCTRVRTRF